MKFVAHILLTLLLIAGFSCKKKKYPDDVVITNSAIYYSSINVNGNRIRLEAGIDDYYMYSSYKQDSNNVYAFVGEMRKTNCSNCPNSLKIQINDYKPSVFNSPVKPDSSFVQGSYPYSGLEKDPTFSVSFTNSLIAQQYSWNFGDGSTSTEKNPVHTYSKPGKYNVCLTTKSGNGCVSSICNVYHVENVNKLKVSIGVSDNSGNTISFKSSVTGGTGPFKYFWSFGNGRSSNLPNPVCNYQYRGGYPVSLVVVDSQLDTAYCNFNAVTQSDPYSCAANYDLYKITPLPNSIDLASVIVTWRDEAGVEYKSNTYPQDASSYFKIISVADGENNENGQRTKKLLIRFTCKVYNGSNSVNLSDAETVICVAYR